MHHWTGSELVQIMACRLFGAKPFSKPMLGYCQLDPYEQTSVKFFIKIQNFPFTEMHLKISSAKWWPFCPGGELGRHLPKLAHRVLFTWMPGADMSPKISIEVKEYRTFRRIQGYSRTTRNHKNIHNNRAEKKWIKWYIIFLKAVLLCVLNYRMPTSVAIDLQFTQCQGTIVSFQIHVHVAC